MFISVTKLKIKNIWSLIPFCRRTLPAFAQAKKAPGNIFAETRTFDLFTYGTLSGWESEEAMRRYIGSGAHMTAMKVSREITILLQSSHFELSHPPTWPEALVRMEADLYSIKFSKLVS